MSNSLAPPDRPAHLDGVEDGAGCVEIWERLSAERRAEATADD